MLNDPKLELAALQQLQWSAEPLASQLEPEDFGTPEYKKFFTCMVFHDGFIDCSATEEKIKNNYAWLDEIANARYMGAPYQLLHRLRVLRARREARQFKSKAQDENIPQEFMQKSEDITRMLQTRGETKEDIVQRIQKGVPKIQTGFTRFDSLCLGGIEHGGMAVIAAMPGVGKTALAVNIARNVINEGKSVCFLSLEMASEAITTRLLQCFWGETVNTVKKHAHDMVNLPADFHALMPSNNIDTLLGEAMLYLESDIFIIDYFDLINEKGVDSQSSRLESISHKIKNFAFRHKKPIIVLSQFNKDLEKSSSNREPVLSDLHGTSALAKDAHIISFLWDKNAKDSQSKDGDEYLENPKANTAQKDLRWIIKKNRNGINGMVYMEFDPTIMTFIESSDTSFRV